MTMFWQAHFLTVYPPSNPNRDDMGRPKTAFFGEAARLRISSQAIKRAVRTSDQFRDALSGNLGARTQRIGERLVKSLVEEGVDRPAAEASVKPLLPIFGKPKSEGLHTEQLAFISPDEEAAALTIARQALEGRLSEDDKKKLASMLLRPADGAADIAMFGRMLAGQPRYNREAAVQVGHAITTHRAEVEDDYYTAVDDLKTRDEDAGAGFLDEAGFGSGVYYLYACVNCDLLVDNLGGDKAIAKAAIAALAEGLATATPSGKQNSFAHHPRAMFIRAETGAQQPRDLSAAFFKPVRAGGERGTDLMAASIDALEAMAAKIDKAYGPACDGDPVLMNVTAGEGSLADVKASAEVAVERVGD
mgnify:CR=1 FL=1